MSTEKIIFWNRGNFFHFLLAHSLQKKINSELYAVFDIADRQKSFYQKQKFVDYKKIWFYYDAISKPRKKIDVEYLNSFEEKFNINLWLLALNERLLNEHNEFYKFSREEILSILEDECKFFEKILEIKPKFLIIMDPTFHYDELFYQMCEASGIKTIVFTTRSFGGKCILSEKVHVFDDNRTSDKLGTSNRDFDEIQRYWKKFEFRERIVHHSDSIRTSKIAKIKAGFDFLSSQNSSTKNNYGYYGHTKPKALANYFVGILKKNFRSNYIDKNLSYVIDDSVPFVYFPLHQMPDLTLLIGSPFNTNQIEIIRHISKSLPIGYKLYVKEHPTQVLREWRKTSFYKEILSIPNVQLLHYSVKTEDVLKKCSLVITINGIPGLEAAIFKKPAIIFSDSNYSMLPSVHKLESIYELPDAIRSSLRTKVNANDVDKYLNLFDSHSFAFEMSEYELDYQNHFYYGGHLLDTEIPEEKVKQFIKKYESVFDTLADEYIKKFHFHNSSL
jgi:hypothetical protein